MSAITSQRISSQDIELGDGPVGCFLIHGFSGSPYEIRELAEFLAGNGYRVVARVLAGHGTSVADCNRVRAEDWLEETEFHFTELILECEATFVIGLSMGAVLALHLAILFPVAGVVAMSTAFTFSSGRYWRLLPLLAPFVPAISKKRANAGRNVHGQQYSGYDSYPLKGLRQMLRLNHYVREKLPQLSAPALIMHSHADITAPPANARLVLDTIHSQDKQLIEYHHSSHILPAGSEKEQVWADTLQFLQLHAPSIPDEILVHQSG